MPKSRTQPDPLPHEFKNEQELTQFWDTHDTEDYPDAWREVKLQVRMTERKYPRILLEPRLAAELGRRANTLGISLNDLVNQLLQDGLRHPTR